MTAPIDLLVADLNRSALPDDAPILYHIEPLIPEDTKRLCGYEVPSAAFIYHDPDGTERDFARVKYLAPIPTNSWTQGANPGKYWQEPRSGSHLYFPLSEGSSAARWNWPEVLEDPQVPLYITEGEKKAICGVHHGLPMLAVAGVNNWRSSRQVNHPVIPDVDLIDFEARTVFLCFDADANTNPHVAKALNDLATELTTRGARAVRVVNLPSNTHLGPKIGVDDYIKGFGLPAFKALCTDADDVKRTKVLWSLNERFAFIDSLAAVYDTVSQSWHRRNAFFDITSALRVATVRLSGRGEDTTARIEEEPANKVWWEWASRRSYARHTYAPGEPEVILEQLEDRTLKVFNTWRGWGCAPRLGNADPFIKLFDHLTVNLTPIQQRWFLRWLAWPIQNPRHGKQITAVLIHSATQGSGKSYLGEIMCDIYGADNALMLASPEQMFGAHATYFEQCQFVLADEVLLGTRSEVDRVKNFITQPSLIVNPKGLPAYKVPARMNWYLTSNHSDALKLDNNDRRWFIINAPETRLSEELVRELRDWRDAGGAACAMRYLQEVSLGKFEPWQPAPATAAKQAMVQAARSETEEWCHQLSLDPDAALQVDGVALGCDLFTESDWSTRMILPARMRPTVVRNQLASLGFERRPRLRSRLWKGGEKTLWCLRNRDHWANATNAQWCEHYASYLNQRGISHRSALHNAPKARKGVVVSITSKKGKEERSSGEQDS